MEVDLFRVAPSSLGLDAEIARLQACGLLELRSFWSARWGRAPGVRSADLLRRVIAWRLQAEATGGLDDETLASLCDRSAGQALRPGTRLTREYRGVLHDADVEPEGLVYAGARFRSLSQIASHITGTHWNGPRFFGLR